MNCEEINREWVFGIRPDVQEVVVHVDNERILYPAGRSLVLHTVSQPHQTFVPLAGDGDPTALAISDKRDLLAICFSGPSAMVEIWNLETMQKEKSLTSSDVVSNSFVSASFCSENKMLVAQGGKPDWTLVLFVVEKGKVFSILRLTDTQEINGVASVAFHPQDPGVLSIVGEGILRMMRLHDKLLKPWGYPAGHEHTCICQEWVDVHILLVGTNKATVLVLEDGELRAQLSVNHPDLAKWEKSSDEEQGVNSIAELGKSFLPKHREVTAIKSYEGGFLCACGPDKIFVFQKSENIHEFFTQKLLMRICEPSTAARVSGRGDHTITCLSITPNQKFIVASTHSAQLFLNKLPSLEESQMQKLVFSPLHSLYHEGDIIDMDCCLWKPIAVTCGKDKTLRLWDLIQHKLLFQHTFKEDIYSVALHPTGLHVAVGLTDALHLFHVMFDGVRHYNEFKIRRCALSKFSWGGQYLAATDSNLLTLFSSMFLKRLATLKGHTNKIRGIAWLPDDSSLVSCSADGGIFGWDLQTSSVAWEVRTTECQFLTTGMFSVETEGPTILSGNANMIFHLNIGQMADEGSFDFGTASCIAFSAAKSVVFVGTSEGNVFAFKFPAILTSRPIKLGAHATAVTRVVITRDEERMITCGDDGVIIIWKLPSLNEQDAEMKNLMEKIGYLPKVPEMLVAQDDIENMLSKLKELEGFVSYLKKDKSHHLGLQEKEFESLKTDLINKNNDVVNGLEKKIQEVEMLLEVEKDDHHKEYLRLKDTLKQSEIDLKEELHQKLIYEYEKQDKIEERLNELKLTNMEEKKIWEEKARSDLETNLSEQETTIKNLNHQLQKITTELEKERVESAQLLRLVEASTEVELRTVRSSLHFQLAEEQKRSTKLREERASLQRKIELMENENDSLNSRLRDLEQGKKQMEENLASMETNLISLRREVQHRNKIIADREGELADKNLNLEEHKKEEILHEHQISWLESQLQPSKESLQEKTDQINQMEEEISDARLQIEGRDRQVKHLSQRLVALQGYNSSLRKQLHTVKTQSLRLQGEVANASNAIHEPKKLKEAVKIMAEKHLEKFSSHDLWTRTFLTDEKDHVEKQPDLEVKEIKEGTYWELLRQRQLLEKAVETLQRKSEKDCAAHKSKTDTLYKENRKLLDEVKSLKLKITKVENLLKESEIARKNMKKKNIPTKINVSLSLQESNKKKSSNQQSDKNL